MLSYKLIPADYYFTQQSAEMIMWAMQLLQAESACKADSVLVIVCV